MSKFPLPAKFFRQPPLTEDEADHLCHLADTVAQDFIRHAVLENGPIRWTLTSNEGHYQIYDGDDPMAPSGVVTSCGVTEIFATIDEVARLFRSETPAEHIQFTRRFLTDCLDSVKLYTVVPYSRDAPRNLIGVNWTALESPAPLVARNRDFSCLEVQRDFEVRGRRGWLRALKSLDVPCCPDFRSALGLVRAEMYRVGHLAVESDKPGYLKIIQINQGDMKSQLPHWILTSGVKRRCRAVGEIDRYVCEARLGQSGFAPISAMVPTNTRGKCFLCHKKFGTFQAKKSCRKCGEVVCSSCSQSWTLLNNGNPEKMRICTACGRGANPLNPAVEANPTSPEIYFDDKSPHLKSHPLPTPQNELESQNDDLNHRLRYRSASLHHNAVSPSPSRVTPRTPHTPLTPQEPIQTIHQDGEFAYPGSWPRGKSRRKNNNVPMLELDDPVEEGTVGNEGTIVLGSDTMSFSELGTIRPQKQMDKNEFAMLYKRMQSIYQEIANLHPIYNAEEIARLHEELHQLVANSS